MKIRALFLISIFIAGLAFFAFFTGGDLLMSGAKPGSDNGNEKIIGYIEGFKPDSKVTYKIFTPGNETLSGQRKTGPQGRLSLPEYEVNYKINGSSDSYFTYDITVDQGAGQDPFSTVFTFDSDARKISILGKGLDVFSEVSFQKQDKKITTRADWTGNFRNYDILDFDDFESDLGVKVAFYDNGFASDVQNPDPKIIKILSAPGGGGPSSAGVNNFSTGLCLPIPFSYCGSAGTNSVKAIVTSYVLALRKMTDQLSASMLYQTGIIGTFFDAKMQLQTDREIRKLSAEAHKDYQPSDMMCRFGSFIKSVPRAENQARIEKLLINSTLMTVYTNTEHASSSEGQAEYMKSKMEQFRRVYCDPADNNNGLDYMCEHDQDHSLLNSVGAIGALDPVRMNKDINYAHTMGGPLTLPIDFENAPITAEEEDVLALARNLYWPETFAFNVPETLSDKARKYMSARSIMAMNNVAHNSFAHIAAMKSQTDVMTDVDKSGWNFMKSMMREFGISDVDIHLLLGDFPSYYAQMEVLTKKIYQNPDFYTNLYDKPANVDRIGASIDVIKLMQARDHFDASLRREMLTSLLVEQALAKHTDKATTNINDTWVNNKH